MRLNKLLKISAMMAFLFMTNQPAFCAESQEAYDKYLNAYQAYQNALAENKSSSEVEAALKAYSSAKNEYVNTINSDSRKKVLTTAAPTTNEMIVVNESTEVEQLNSVGISSKISSTSKIANLSDIQRDTQDLYDKLDSLTQSKIDELRETQDKDKAQKLIAEIENKMSSVNDADISNFMKYELATALDRLSLDEKKANQYLDELEKTKNDRFVKLVKLNKSYKEAKAKKKAWSYDLMRQNDELNNTKESYKNASWLAFPVKLVRGVKSVYYNVQFTSNEGDFEDYMVEYEAIQSNFIHSVNAVFNEWQAGIENKEDCADIRLIYDNYNAWYARWYILNNAQTSIDVQYFIIEKDAFGLSLLGTLLEKAKAGVKVRLMVDTRGSKGLSVISRGYLIELAKNANVEVKVYNPITSNVLNIFTDVRKVESSNHDKIIIVDGEKCVMGGRNIAKEYLVDEIDMPEAWRDCDIAIDSEIICSQLKLAFDEEFSSMKSYDAESEFLGKFTNNYGNKLLAAHACMEKYLLESEFLEATGDYKKVSSTVSKVNKELQNYVHMNMFKSFNLMDDSHRCEAHILDNNSLTGDRKDITENIVKYIDGSRTEIIIQNPYFAMTDRAEAALKRASKRGIPIYVHSNSERSSDSAPTEAIVLRDWKQMLTEMPTMRFFARDASGQLHGKTFQFDGKVAVIGSYNFDALSEKVNSEVACAIKNTGFCAELREYQMEDIEKGFEYKLGTDTQEEVAPDDIAGAKNKLLTKILSYTHCLDNLF